MANQCNLNARSEAKLNHCYDACSLCGFVAIVKMRNKNSSIQVGVKKKAKMGSGRLMLSTFVESDFDKR